MSNITLQLPNVLFINYYYQQVNYEIYFSKSYLNLFGYYFQAVNGHSKQKKKFNR